MKNGDKIKCKYSEEYNNLNEFHLTIDKTYVVENLKDKNFNVTNDIGNKYYYATSKSYTQYYGRWFYTDTEQQMRKKKLKKLANDSTNNICIHRNNKLL